jgi:sugar/nucleoside kinase (ribokinase family)
MNLLIVGSVATDSIKTPFGKVTRALGGSATYASISASYFTQPGIVGVVGKDFDKKHISLLKRKGVDLAGLQIDQSGKTFHWAGYYEGDMNQAHTIKTELNVFERFTPTIPAVYQKAPYVLLGNIHPALQLEVLAQVKRPKLVLCDTMNFWITSAPKLLEQVFRKVDIICVNDGEACQFCNTSSLPKAARELLKLGAKRVIIKKGAHGVQLFGKGSFFSLPALPLDLVKDPTGAGDSFAGGAMGWLAKSKSTTEDSYRRALVIGTVLASHCVQDFSCKKTSRLKQSDISARIKELKEATVIPSISWK